jgi:hypothetical protein
MSLFEWLGESCYPGPVGDVDASRRPLFQNGLKRIWALLLMTLGLTILVFLVRFSLHSGGWQGFALLGLYLVLAYFITPNPDTSNVGWMGGLVDHPFRISDDMNRFLVFFYLFLLPGKLVVFALQTLTRFLRLKL